MTGALIILAVTVLTGVVLYITRDRTPQPPAPDTTSPASDPADAGEALCCGRHAVCEKGLLSPDDLYYDDEELDRFAGHDPETYDDGEVEEFREILYSLRPGEVYSWGMALTARDIPLPLPLRDEWLLLTEK